MEAQKTLILTREKHLDHMVRIVPFIVCCYAIQSYVILKVGPNDFSHISLSILGGFLALMISAFIFYDLKHQVIFNELTIDTKFLGRTKSISYHDILSVVVHDPDHTFSNLKIKSSQGNFTFYFIDDAEKVKSWIEAKRMTESKAA